jgi:hypothetical protein
VQVNPSQQCYVHLNTGLFRHLLFHAAGFMAQLMRLDRQLHGTCSIQPSEMPRAKPEARICSICGAAAGISYESLVRHTKAKHGLANPPLTAAAGSAGSAAAAPA